ncbi:MAG TPA: DUF2569 domain-containing protein [Allosphingosinicella sp.]|uniref:DUF2569 domain-containing protein n=1 Tax=Allosphingosinicella sp. TaxID=2823234 RepID=UPI002ED961FB
MNRVASNLHARSIVLVDQLQNGIPKILVCWAIAAGLACALRLSLAVWGLPLDRQLTGLLPYILVVGAPIASLILALRWFRRGDRLPQPTHRLARIGRWKQLDPTAARRLPFYGVSGLMASLLVGMLLNVPVRTLEFLTAIPAFSGAAPSWFSLLFTLMLADVVLLSSLYAIAFVAALRRVPLFPRLLAAIWGIDLLMQVGVAKIMAGAPDLPPVVGTGLHDLLEGNVKKVLISMALWTPYLLLSKRVNVTFRHRIPA